MTREGYEEIHYSLFSGNSEFLGCAWALSSTELITCAHVTADPSIDVVVRRSFCKRDEEIFVISRTTGLGDPLYDASRLNFKGPAHSMLPTPSGQGICDPTTGQRFTVFGFPVDKPNLGDFANYEIGRQLPNGWFQVEIYDPRGAELREGYSGAPAWDPVLQCVIGIVVGVDPMRRQQIAYIIPPSVLNEQIGSPPSNKFPYFGPVFHERIAKAALCGFELRRAERYLSSAATAVADGVQRYWIYTCLGEFSPDRSALETLRFAASVDRDVFAVKGALEALSRFPNEDNGGTHDSAYRSA